MLVSGATSRYNCNKDACSALDGATKQLFLTIQNNANTIINGLPLPADQKQKMIMLANGVITAQDAVIIAFVLKGLAASARRGPLLRDRATPQDVADKAEEIAEHLQRCVGSAPQQALANPVLDFFTTHKRHILIGAGALMGVTVLWWGIRASFQARQSRQQLPAAD